MRAGDIVSTPPGVAHAQKFTEDSVFLALTTCQREEGKYEQDTIAYQVIEGYIPLCQSLRKATDLAVWIKPNAGLPVVEDEKTIFYTTAQEFVKHVPELIQAGANFVGACCGSDQEFVKEIRKVVDLSQAEVDS